VQIELTGHQKAGQPSVTASTHLVKIHRFSDARVFLDRAEAWLVRSEAEHNLILGIGRRLLGGDHPYEKPIYLATVESDSELLGCAWRTPPFKLGLTRLPVDSLPYLVRDVADVYDTLPAVLGPEAEVIGFADLWTRCVGGSWSIDMRQRIYSLDRVTASAASASGGLRRAEISDLSLASDWCAGFGRDTGHGFDDPLAGAEQMIRSGGLYVWGDPELRSMAAAVGPTANGIRIGHVYTPPEFRGRGYGTACVAALSQRMLDDGLKFCFLYTDRANPTSNAIYQRIGYRLVCDVLDAKLS